MRTYLIKAILPSGTPSSSVLLGSFVLSFFGILLLWVEWNEKSCCTPFFCQYLQRKKLICKLDSSSRRCPFLQNVFLLLLANNPVHHQRSLYHSNSLFMQFYFICEPNFNIFSLISFLASSLPQHRLQETDLHSITIEIREATIEEAIQVHNSIEEFQTNGWSTQAFEERYRGKDPLIIVCRHLYGPGEGNSFVINEFVWLFWLVIIL